MLIQGEGELIRSDSSVIDESHLLHSHPRQFILLALLATFTLGTKVDHGSRADAAGGNLASLGAKLLPISKFLSL